MLLLAQHNNQQQTAPDQNSRMGARIELGKNVENAARERRKTQEDYRQSARSLDDAMFCLAIFFFFCLAKTSNKIFSIVCTFSLVTFVLARALNVRGRSVRLIAKRTAFKCGEQTRERMTKSYWSERLCFFFHKERHSPCIAASDSRQCADVNVCVFVCVRETKTYEEREKHSHEEPAIFGF